MPHIYAAQRTNKMKNTKWKRNTINIVRLWIYCMYTHPFHQRRTTTTTSTEGTTTSERHVIIMEQEREKIIVESVQKQLSTDYIAPTKRLTKPRQCYYLVNIQLYVPFAHLKSHSAMTFTQFSIFFQWVSIDCSKPKKKNEFTSHVIWWFNENTFLLKFEANKMFGSLSACVIVFTFT